MLQLQFLFCYALHSLHCLSMSGFSMAENSQMKPTESIFVVITCNKTNRTICVERPSIWTENCDISRQGFLSIPIRNK